MQSISVLPFAAATRRAGHFCMANPDPGATKEDKETKMEMWVHEMSLKGMLMRDRVSAERREIR